MGSEYFFPWGPCALDSLHFALAVSSSGRKWRGGGESNITEDEVCYHFAFLLFRYEPAAPDDVSIDYQG